MSNILFAVLVQPLGCYHLVSPDVAADYVRSNVIKCCDIILCNAASATFPTDGIVLDIPLLPVPVPAWKTGQNMLFKHCTQRYTEQTQSQQLFKADKNDQDS